MSNFNYNEWLRQNKSGPYQKTFLKESEDMTFKVIGKSKHHLIAYPDPQGGYTKGELTAWLEKGHELGQTRRVEFVGSKEEAMNTSEELEEDTYSQTYEDGGPENPQPEDEQFQESMDNIYNTQGSTNIDISYYSDAELDMDNDRMTDKYSVPNPGGDVDDNAVWKEKPFNNRTTPDFERPNKYGW